MPPADPWQVPLCATLAVRLHPCITRRSLSQRCVPLDCRLFLGSHVRYGHNTLESNLHREALPTRLCLLHHLSAWSSTCSTNVVRQSAIQAHALHTDTMLFRRAVMVDSAISFPNFDVDCEGSTVVDTFRLTSFTFSTLMLVAWMACTFCIHQSRPPFLWEFLTTVLCFMRPTTHT